MAITQSAAPDISHTSTDASKGLALFLLALSMICGLFSFVLCLAAEGSRTEARWYIMSNQGNISDTSHCIYDASGRRPLTFAVGAFLSLVVAMFAEHAYILIVITTPRPLALVPRTPQPPTPPAEAPTADVQRLSSSIRTQTWQACYIFLTTWICFAIAEALLIVGMAVESSHLCQWGKPRSSCHVIRPGLFAAAGVFGLLTVLLGIALYLAVSRTQKLHQEAEPLQRRPPSTPTPSAPAAA